MKKSIFAILLLASLSSVGQVVTAPMPSPRFQVFTSAGLPLAGGCLFSYQAGTSNPLATYKDNLGVAQNSNPVLLDSTGSADVWLGPQKYKLQLFSAGGVNCASGSLLWTRDGVYGPNLPVTTTLALIAQTAPSCVAASYTIWADSSATRFKMCNNGTADVVVGANTTDTLTNKTLTSPTLNTPSIATPTFSGNGSGTIGGNLTLSGQNVITAKSLNTRLYASAFSGADACAKINAALLALPATGGLVDATGFQGTQSCGSNPFASFTGTGQVLLGSATFQTTASWIVPTKTQLRGIGRGDSGSTNTSIQAITGFPPATPVVQFGASAPAFGIHVENLQVDCNNQTTSIGIQNFNAQEQSAVRDVTILNCPNRGLDIGSASQNSGPYENIEILNQSGGSSGTLPVVVNQVASFRGIRGMTINANGATSPTVAIQADSSGTFENIHCEHIGDCIKIGSVAATSGVVVQNMECGPAITNCVHISNAFTSQNIDAFGVITTAGTAILDDILSATVTDSSVGTYILGNGIGTAKTRFTDSNNFGNQLSSKLSMYNSIATASNGVPSEYATIDLTAQNNNIGNTSLYVAPASGAGLYRVSCYVVVTTAAGTSSTLPNCNLLWTDKDNSQAQTIAIATGGSGNTLTTLAQGTVVVNVKASTTMQYSTTGYASNAANAMQYAIHIKLEAL